MYYSSGNAESPGTRLIDIEGFKLLGGMFSIQPKNASAQAQVSRLTFHFLVRNYVYNW